MWAVTRPNLFEYLAKPVEDRPFGDSTEITEADDDEYDAPHFTAGASSFGPDFIWAETMNTRADEDTYDDDVGIGALSIPFSSLETTKTSMTYDTYDNDVDVLVAGTPIAAYDQTYVTKVENETYDDDPSAESLSFPTT